MDRMLINGFYIPVLPRLTYFKDGEDANTVLFIEAPKGEFFISFEEGMKCIDLILKDTERQEYIYSEYVQDSRYLHQCRAEVKGGIRKGVGQGRYSMMYFHMKIPDQNGDIHVCPGQMGVASGHSWSDGVEPILLELLQGITVADEAMG